MSAVLLTLGLVASGESMPGCSAGGAGHVTIRKRDCEFDLVHLSSSGAAINFGIDLRMGDRRC